MPTVSAMKQLLATGGQLVSLLTVFGLMVLFFDRMTGDELVEVGAATAVAGQVTKCDVNRQHYYWYLDGGQVRYDLWSFTAGDSATRQMQDSIQRANQDNIYYYNTLAYYLRTGDQLRKTAGSPLLTLRRGGKTTVWTCAGE